MINTKKILSTLILSTFAIGAFATGYPAPSQNEIIKSASNTKKITNSINDAQLLSPIKDAIPNLVVFDIHNSQIGDYKEVESNAGTLFVDGKGNVLMGAKKVMLINYDHSDLTNIEMLKKVIHESTGYTVTAYNQDGGMYYFKAGDITIVTNKNVLDTPYALMGAFVTTTQLAEIKSHINSNSQVQTTKSPSPVVNQEQLQAKKRAGRKAVLKYIDKNYPNNLIYFKTEKADPIATLTVFTDYSCAHCQDFHKHLKSLLNEGYNVNYILMPRDPRKEEVVKNMQQALCAVNPTKTTEYLYQYHRLPSDLKERDNCQVKIKDNLSFAEGFSVTGTPTIVASNGYMTSGFSTTFGLLNQLGLTKVQKGA
ncbi:thioredoxin fold domain-containing protein [Fangia hongkongensis]|uniref:thioredoxin fold domain-containing protein n=1 Tax=Fangia hongkongensis TaxID=270495 RepID=UPI00035FC3C9|nr:thioredoxin fold domain-containing protein [Fangia hongkongensis]MBK2124441.1 thioredoxin fold domain-containing protein [Fangia hongkongensis]